MFFAFAWPMSNAVQVTQTTFSWLKEGGRILHHTSPHNRRPFVVLWPFGLYGNKCVWFVPPLLFGAPLVHMKKAYQYKPGCSFGAHLAPATTGPFRKFGLGLKDLDPCRGAVRPVTDGGHRRNVLEKLKSFGFCVKATNEWASLHAFFPWTFLDEGLFTRHSSSKGWAWIIIHQMQGPLLSSLMFIARGLGRRKRL